MFLKLKVQQSKKEIMMEHETVGACKNKGFGKTHTHTHRQEHFLVLGTTVAWGVVPGLGTGHPSSTLGTGY